MLLLESGDSASCADNAVVVATESTRLGASSLIVRSSEAKVNRYEKTLWALSNKIDHINVTASIGCRECQLDLLSLCKSLVKILEKGNPYAI